jgi:hypothetical protein
MLCFSPYVLLSQTVCCEPQNCAVSQTLGQHIVITWHNSNLFEIVNGAHGGIVGW